MVFGEVMFCTPNETILKENSTVEDLIGLLHTFPKDLPISAAFRCILDSENYIVSLEDEKVNELLDILLACPMCSQHFKVDEPIIN